MTKLEYDKRMGRKLEFDMDMIETFLTFINEYDDMDGDGAFFDDEASNMLEWAYDIMKGIVRRYNYCD